MRAALRDLTRPPHWLHTMEYGPPRWRPWFYRWSKGDRVLPWFGGDEWCRHTLVIGLPLVGQVVVPLWGCRDPRCEACEQDCLPRAPRNGLPLPTSRPPAPPPGVPGPPDRPATAGDDVSTETLRKAAADMRAKAQAATPGPWWVGEYPSLTVLGTAAQYGEVVGEGDCGGGTDTQATAAHIASWPPEMALAVADLLDLWAGVSDDPPLPVLRIAQTYLGETT